MPGESSNDRRKKISFHFRPYESKKGDYAMYAIEKAEGDHKRRFLKGITSGIKVDGHDERMTKKCIKSFMSQANSGEILLYPDIHGIKASEDIGRLVNCAISPVFDWETEYKLHDATDGIGPVKKERIETIWKQMNGKAPYKRPIHKGFSIEGTIPDEGIIEAEEDGQGGLINRVIDDVQLDGVVLVPKPAYKDGIANAVYKALGEMAPWQIQKITKGIREELRDQVKDQELRDKYYSQKWDISEALEKVIEKIMKGEDLNKQEQLEIAFDEYKELMIEVLMKSTDLFASEEEGEDEENAFGVSMTASKPDVLKAVLTNLQKYLELRKRRINTGGKK